jgi:hypothetical protein
MFPSLDETPNSSQSDPDSQSRKVKVDPSQQISHDAEPFRIQWLLANRLPCRPTIPVRCVALIAFPGIRSALADVGSWYRGLVILGYAITL